MSSQSDVLTLMEEILNLSSSKSDPQVKNKSDEPIVPDISAEIVKPIDVMTVQTKLTDQSDHYVVLPANLNYAKPEIYLQGMEYSDSDSFIRRYPIMSVRRAVKSRVNIEDKLTIGNADLEFLEKTRSKFLLESIEILNHRSRLAFYSSSVTYDLKNLSNWGITHNFSNNDRF